MAKRRIEGCRVLLTGASSGIGRELAFELSRQGARLVLVARREDRLSETCDLVSNFKGECLPVLGDITAQETRQRALETTQNRLGGLDLLINNAGISAHGRFAEASPDRLRQIMEVNFFAAAELIREAVPLLIQGQQPAVIIIGSILARRGIPRNSEYCASKFALQGLSEAIRPELAKQGIMLLMVNPGPTDTPFFDHLLEKDASPAWKDKQGAPADRIARKIVQAIQRKQNEIVPSWPGRGLLALNRLSPRLADWVMSRYG